MSKNYDKFQSIKMINKGIKKNQKKVKKNSKSIKNQSNFSRKSV